jgi:hypothetical protein
MINTIAPNLLDMKSDNNIPIAMKKDINPIICFREFFISLLFVHGLVILYAID